MKYSIFALFVFVLWFTSDLWSQNLPDENYVFNKSKVHISGLGGVMCEMSSVGSELAFSTGGGGAIIIANRYMIGGYGMGLSTNHYRRDVPGYTGTALRTSLGHGGIWAGYIFKPAWRVHLGLSSRFGWGSISHNYKSGTNDALQELTTDNIFVITPEILGEVNITPWLKFNLGAGYRYITGISLLNYNSSSYNSPTFTASLIFGGFDDDSQAGDAPAAP